MSPADPATPANYISDGEMARWAAVLERFDVVPPRPATGYASPRNDWQSWLDSECVWSERLLYIRDRLRGGDLSGYGWDHLGDEARVRAIGELAEAHYRTFWSPCTDLERLVLIRLANEGFVNPRNWEVVRRLMARGLVRRTPAIRIMNESFHDFVCAAEPCSVVDRWEHAAGPSRWRRIRAPLLATLLGSGVFVFATQPDALTRVLGVLTAIAGGTGALSQILGLFRGSKDATPAAAAHAAE